MIIIGIDPGVSGGIGIIPLYDFYSSQMYSFSSFSLTDLSLLLQEYRTGNSLFSSSEEKDIDTQVEIYLEEPSLPQTNHQNGNKFNIQAHKKLNRSIGQIEGVCVAHGYPPILVPPTRWQGFLNCKTKGNKRLTLDLAQDIFGHHKTTTKSTGQERSKVTHATADALLIALYGYLQYANHSKLPSNVRRFLDIPTILANLIKKKPSLPRRTPIQAPRQIPRAPTTRSQSLPRPTPPTIKRPKPTPNPTNPIPNAINPIPTPLSKQTIPTS